MEHVPVLLHECLEGLRIKPNGIYVDGTLGRGGHAREIAKKLDKGRLIAIDRDAVAIEKASESLSEYNNKLTLIHGNFGDLSGLLDENDVEEVDGMLFDLGVSSPQLDDAGRGFSYSCDAPLDMRMDRRDEMTARDAVNRWPEEKLRDVFYKYGEERYARSIARAIVSKREEAPIETTLGLSGVIVSAVPAAARREAQHPSKRCFQALRIAVNDELGSIQRMLDSAPERLNTGGRLCVISFHSLEDRLVKNAFAARVGKCTCPKDFPVCVCNAAPELNVITRKPIIPGAMEVSANPRARSAKLRIAEKL